MRTATPTSSLQTPSNALALALILSYIDAHPSTLTTLSSQKKFLESLCRKHKFPYYSSTYGHTFHDSKSLRHAIVAILRNYTCPGVDIRPGKKVIDEFFERGRELLQKKYLQAVEEAAEREMQEPAVGQREEMVSSEEEEDIDGTGEMVDEIEERRIREILEDSHSSDEEYEPGKKKRKRRGRMRSARKRTRSLSLVASADEEERDEEMKDKTACGFLSPPPSLQKSETLTEDLRSNSSPPCGRNDDLVESDESKCPERKVSRIYLQDDSGDEGDDERQMSIPCQKPKRRRVQRSPRQRVLEEENPTKKDTTHLSRDIQQLNSKIESVVLAFFALVNLDPSRSADVVLNPNTDLRALYAQVLGADWKQTAFNLKCQRRLQANDFLRSLISAFLTDTILSAEVPWASTLSLLATDTPFQKYAAPLLRPVDTRALLHEAEAAQLRDEEFLDAQVRPRARGLAADLRLVLHDHLDLFNQFPSLWHETLMQGLQEVCAAALELRGWIGVVGGRAEGVSIQEAAFTVFPRVEWPDGEVLFPGVVVLRS